MKILELTNYTAGGCGVGARVLRESKMLSKRGHEVVIFSTNREKGTGKICSLNEKIDNVLIKRFPSLKLGGDSFMNWNFKKEAIKFNPDLIIAHSYRHTHTTKALAIAKSTGSKVFLVTHAPFARHASRNLIEKAAVFAYDLLIGRTTLKKFDKVIAITNWEMSYLDKLGLSSKKIEYIPNGVDDEFFKPLKLSKKNNPMRIVYLGRISPIKQIETLIEASQGEFTIEIIGPAERDYHSKLSRLIKKVNSNSVIKNKLYNKLEQIKILDSSDVFVLPSKSEGLPQTLLEAMARGKVVVASDNNASRDIIINGKNGFLYKNGSSKSLRELLKNISLQDEVHLTKIRKEARLTAEKFRWKEIIKKIEKLAK